MKIRNAAVQICALLITGVFSGAASAATVSFTEFYSESGGTGFGPFDTGFLAGFGTPLDALPQFDPSMGTLTSVTLSYEGSLTLDAIFSAGPQSDPGSPSEAFADYVGGVGLAVPIGASLTLQADSLFSDTVGCFIDPGMDFCDEGSGLDDAVASSVMFTGSDMDAFIGTGSLEELRLELLAGLDFEMFLENFDDAFLEVNVDFVGEVTVEYEYAPIPVPGAVWLFGSALLGLMIRRR